MPTKSSNGLDTPLRVALCTMAAMAAAVGIGRFVYTPILPEMLAQLGLSGSEAGLIASANFLGYLVGALLAATPGLPGSRRSWLGLSLWANALLVAATAVSPWLPALVAVRFAAGVANAFVMVFASAMLFDAALQARRPGLIRVHFAGPGLGIILSTAIVSAAIALGAGWQVDWLVAALPCLAAAILFAVAMPADRGGERRMPAMPLRSAPGLARLSLSYGLFGFGYVITATFLLAMIREAETAGHLEPVTWIAFGLAAMPSVIAWSWISARVGLLNAYALACLVEAIGVALSVAWQAPAGFIISAILLGGTLIGITALGFQAVGALVVGDTRRPMAVITAAFGIGQIVGPLIAGLTKDLTGSLLPATAAAAAALVAAAALGWSIRLSRPTAAAAPPAAAATTRHAAAGRSHPESHDAPHAAEARYPSHGG